MLKWLIRYGAWWGAKKLPDVSPPTEPASEDGEGETKPFLEHLEDLRRTLFKIAGALFVGFNVCLIFANKLLFFLEKPLDRVGIPPETFLQSLNVSDSFVLSMQLAFYCGILVASPLIFYFIGQFILPALKHKERALMVPAFAWGAVLFITGAAACYYLIVPRTLWMFIEYSKWMKIKPQWTVTSYIEFVTQFMLSCGITFEVPLVILILVRLGVVSAATVAHGRKVMIASGVILAALLAPADPLSMVYMAIPLVGICEITIWLAKIVEYRRNKRLAKQRAAENRDA